MDDKKTYSGDKQARVVTGIYVIICLLLLFAFKWDIPETYASEGVIVNLGYTESGMNENTPTATEEVKDEPEVAPEEKIEEEVVEESQEESITQDVETTPVVATEKPLDPITKPVEEVIEEVLEEKVEEVEEKPQVDPNSLFQSNNNNPNEGEGNETGDQGKEEGSLESNIYGDVTGPGSGDSGKGFGLSGRSATGLPSPKNEKQEYGTVVIQISVGKDGKVKSAKFVTVKGVSNTFDSYLVNLSVKEAYKASFNADSNAPETQIGWLRFNYKP